MRIADFKSPAFVDNCCTFILSIWILIQQTFDSVDRHKNKLKNTKRYTNGNKTTVFAIALMLNTSLFETYVETNHAMERKYYDTRTRNYCNCMHISPSHLFSDTNKNLKINHTMTIEKKYNDYIYNKHAALCCCCCFFFAIKETVYFFVPVNGLSYVSFLEHILVSFLHVIP